MSQNGGETVSDERWKGRVDEKLRVLGNTTEETKENITKIFEKVETLQNQVTKLIVYVGLGAFFGSAIVSVVVGLVIKWATK